MAYKKRVQPLEDFEGLICPPLCSSSAIITWHKWICVFTGWLPVWELLCNRQILRFNSNWLSKEETALTTALRPTPAVSSSRFRSIRPGVQCLLSLMQGFMLPCCWWDHCMDKQPYWFPSKVLMECFYAFVLQTVFMPVCFFMKATLHICSSD